MSRVSHLFVVFAIALVAGCANGTPATRPPATTPGPTARPPADPTKGQFINATSWSLRVWVDAASRSGRSVTAYRDGQRVEQREDPKLARLDEATGGDGRFDLVSFYERDVLVRQEGRTACDRTDVWIRYRDGQKAEQAEDHDCDGRPDMRFVYEGDAVVRKEALK